MEHRTPRGNAGLLAPLRRLCRGLAGLVRRIARELVPRWVLEQLPAPARWIGALFLPGRERGFGYWWLVVTLGIAAAIGMVVALLVSPVAGLVALLVVAVWALVRHARGAHARRSARSSEAKRSGSAMSSMHRS
jgi:apolipoprotein N-acyltransferase